MLLVCITWSDSMNVEWFRICTIFYLLNFFFSREMAMEGLSLKNQGESVSGGYPALRDMLDHICKQQPRLLDSEKMREEKLIFPSRTYLAMIDFLMKCFLADFGQEDSRKADEFPPPVMTLCLLLEHAMAFEGSVELHANASKALVTIGSHFPEVTHLKFSMWNIIVFFVNKFSLTWVVLHVLLFLVVGSISICWAHFMVKAINGACWLWYSGICFSIVGNDLFCCFNWCGVYSSRWFYIIHSWYSKVSM